MENKIDWARKLTSRKLWVAAAAFVSGLIVALGGNAGTAEVVSGCILQGAAVLGYLLAEGLTDAASAAAPAEAVEKTGTTTIDGAVEAVCPVPADCPFPENGCSVCTKGTVTGCPGPKGIG